MFADFKKIVTSNSTSSIPQEILNAYNSKFPVEANVKYVDNHDGSCSLVPDNVSADFTVLLKMPNVTFVDTLPEYVTCQAELIDYMYRTQKAIHCKLHNGFKAVFNGIPVDFTELVKHPYQDLQYGKEIDLYISPPAFPELPPLIFKAGNDILELNVKRTPCEQKDTAMLLAEKDWLSIQFEINYRTGYGNVSIKLLYEKCANAREYSRALNAANNLRSGKYSFSYFKAATKSDMPPINEQHLKFWNKVAALEEILGVSFSPNLPLHVDDVKDFSELFCCFLDKKPFMTPIAPGPTVGLHIETSDSLFDSIGKELTISYLRKAQWDLLGASFSTVFQSFIFNAVIDDIQEEDLIKSRHFVHLIPAGTGDMYLSTFIFLDEDAIENKQSEFNDNNEYISFMSSAQPLKIESAQ